MDPEDMKGKAEKGNIQKFSKWIHFYYKIMGILFDVEQLYNFIFQSIWMFRLIFNHYFIHFNKKKKKSDHFRLSTINKG